MCKELSTPELGPTIMAGMESILVPHGRKSSDEWVNDNITTTLGAIYFYVSERAQWKSSDDQVDQTRYQAARKVIIKTLDGARETATFKGSDQDTAWVGWRSIRPRDLDKAVMEVNKRGWLQSDWYQGMQDLADRTNADDLEDEDHDATEQIQSVEIRRADSMFQDRYDLLSQRRRDDFKVWKAGILERIAALENSTVPMEIDS
ncbi:putative origin recognition complex subunit 6 protein [Phaeoacremonium minimum UCRPA7]|uniref:Putative origin recognition complex subunit 6 protein n=1 Tax=Phaeoacremonium minimum (strain UCR-PA7) TaxID=1286976 RepID=R8BW93_PHAM7|nr:putative origin recognition complex subunit 6 protein [Phaeoacremonium minimum UCRPA7]EOO03600.1 putative origin recognition complex subunit 6 protein [Phaeoacremonium minimum UCRPA7]